MVVFDRTFKHNAYIHAPVKKWICGFLTVLLMLAASGCVSVPDRIQQAYGEQLQQLSRHSGNVDKTFTEETEGELLIYQIDWLPTTKMDAHGFPGKAKRSYLSPVPKTPEDVGAIALINIDVSRFGTYENGAAALQYIYHVAILDKNTLKMVQAVDLVGGEPPAQTSGPNQYGSKISKSKLIETAQELYKKALLMQTEP